MDEKTKDLFQRMTTGDRRALAQAITLLESERADDQKEADLLIEAIRKRPAKKTLRLGISGVPGVGKSSLIEKLGLYFLHKNLKVAVLAIDPSSEITKGSVLGDKTRMEELSRHDEAFIRPSASRGHLGGVAVATHDSIQACEAAGYDIVIIETVGVGQSESHVANLVDHFVFVALPNSGDELQGIKKGILERIDTLVINKFDGESKIAAQVAEKQFKNALKILRKTDIPIFLTSAVYDVGIPEFGDFLLKTLTDADFSQKRCEQEVQWIRQYLEQFLRWEVVARVETRPETKTLEEGVLQGRLSSRVAARELLKKIITFV